MKSHEVTEKVAELKVIAGGRNTASGSDEDIIGGFGPERIRPAKEVASSKK